MYYQMKIMEPGTIHNECSNEYCANENQPGIVKKKYTIDLISEKLKLFLVFTNE